MCPHIGWMISSHQHHSPNVPILVLSSVISVFSRDHLSCSMFGQRGDRKSMWWIFCIIFGMMQKSPEISRKPLIFCHTFRWSIAAPAPGCTSSPWRSCCLPRLTMSRMRWCRYCVDIIDISTVCSTQGSTTYPGCWETVTWILMNKPLYLRYLQI